MEEVLVHQYFSHFSPPFSIPWLLVWFTSLYHILLSRLFHSTFISALISIMSRFLVLVTIDVSLHWICWICYISTLISFMTITITYMTISIKITIPLIRFNWIVILTHSMISTEIFFMTKLIAIVTLNTTTTCSLMTEFITLKIIIIKWWVPLCLCLSNE